jgi:hypothetical protein
MAPRGHVIGQDTVGRYRTIAARVGSYVPPSCIIVPRRFIPFADGTDGRGVRLRCGSFTVPALACSTFFPYTNPLLNLN